MITKIKEDIIYIARFTSSLENTYSYRKWSGKFTVSDNISLWYSL